MEETLKNARKIQTEKIRRKKLKVYEKCQKKIEKQMDRIRRNPQKYKNLLLKQAKTKKYLMVNLIKLSPVYHMGLLDTRKISADKFESRINQMIGLYQDEIKQLIDHPRCVLHIYPIGINDYQLGLGITRK